MGLREEFNEFARESKEDRGRVLAMLESMDGHIKAVSGKADGIRAEIAAHSSSPEAHGIAEGRRTKDDLVKWIGIIFGFAGFSFGLWKLH